MTSRGQEQKHFGNLLFRLKEEETDKQYVADLARYLQAEDQSVGIFAINNFCVCVYNYFEYII